MSWNIKTPGDYINGPLTVAGSATITGALTVGTTLGVTGQLSTANVVKATGNPGLSSAGATEGFLAHNTGYGAVIYGQGTTCDVALLDRNTGLRLSVTTSGAQVGGDLSMTSGNVVIATSGKGIDFSATSSNGTSEILNDYEEGTWVPSVGGTATYTLRSGSYVKVGRLVTVSWDMEILLIGTGDISGIISLPFVVGTATSPANQVGYGATGFFNVLATTVYSMSFYAAANTSIIYAMTKNSLSAGNSVNTAIYGNGTRVQGSLTYMTNS
jgi:hypothetical protein